MMKTLNMQEVGSVFGGISDDIAWGASVGVSAALIGVAIAAAGPITMGAVLGYYTASFISKRYL
jgi:hypothetical protein